MTKTTKPTGPQPTSSVDAEVSKTAEAAKAETRKTAKTVAAETDRAAADLRQTAQRAWSDAYDAASDGVDAVADRGAGHAERQARAARAAADEQPAGSPQSDVLHRASAVLESTADRLRETDLDTTLTDLRAFARRKPALFLAGAAALGFAMARVARASEPDAVSGPDYGDLR